MKLALVAGEASGDLHASEVVRELKALDPSLQSFGIGGDLLAREGMQLMHHAREMAFFGFFNVLGHLPMFRRIFRELIDRIERERPDVVLLVDYPGFNLRVARRCKELGLRVVYYISPQLWAWRSGRVRQIARYVDRMIVLFPFEEAFYRKHGVPVTYVGNPLIGQLAGVPRTKRGGPLRIALLPGSRRTEVASLLPSMIDAIEQLRRERPVDAFIVQAPTIERETLAAIIREKGSDIAILPHDGGEAVASADVALSASGTATLEAAVLGTPVVVMYRLSRANYLLGRWVIQIPHFSLVNIIAGREVVPELLQSDVNGTRIAEEVRKIVAPGRYEEIRAGLAHVRDQLGEPGASRRVAGEIHKMVAG